MEDLEPLRARLRALAAERLRLRPSDAAAFDAAAASGALDGELMMLDVATSAVARLFGGPPEALLLRIVDRWAAGRLQVDPLPASACPAGAVDDLPGSVVDRRQASRLQRLRALGADRVYRRGEWKTTGKRGALQALCAEERAAGRSPFDEKAVRNDLTHAAERERQQAREGSTVDPFASLGR